MENTKIVKMAIVGAGLWGEAHASIYREHMFAEPVAVCDLNRPKAEALAKKFGIGRVYADCEEMLRECPCDAVAIVTPDFLHADIAVACARAGKHMIVEKPLATTRKDVFRMLEAIEKSGVRAMVDLHNRWNPPFNAVKQLVDSGRFERRTRTFGSTMPLGRDGYAQRVAQSSPWFLGSHSLDTMNWASAITRSRSMSARRRGSSEPRHRPVDTYLSTIKYSRGAIAHMENSWITPNGNPNVNDFKFNLLLTDGKFDVDASSHNLLQVTDGQRMITQDVLVKNTVFDKCAGFAYESIRSFVDKLVSGDEFHVTLREAANVTLALLAVMESAETGAPVRVERV